MVQMRYKLLGHSGLRVAEFGLGTMTFGEEWGWGTPRQEAQRIYDAYRDAGGNLIDTSDFYTNGASEIFLKEFIRQDRDAVVLATKYTYASPSQDPNAAGMHRKHLIQAAEASLKRLDTDRIDVLWVNGWDFMTPDFEVMRSLDDLVRSGKILYAGICNAPAWVVARCNTLADLRGWTAFAGLQVVYNLIERTAERDLIPMARAMDLGVIACSPLSEGVLTGKYSVGGDGRGRLSNTSRKALDVRSASCAQAVAEVGSQIGVHPAQVALAWLRARDIIPLLGARTVGQLLQNLASLEVSLSDDQIRHLEEVSAIDLGFPHNYNNNTRRMVFGGMFERIQRHRERGIGVTIR